MRQRLAADSRRWVGSDVRLLMLSLAILVAGAAEAGPRTIALLLPLGIPDDVQKAVLAQVNDAEVELVIEMVASIPEGLESQLELAEAARRRLDALAVIWVNHPTGARVLMHLSQRGGARLVGRTVHFTSEFEQAEGIATIVRGFVQATVGTSEGEAPARARRWAWLSVRAGWSAEWFASTTPLVHGLFAQLAVRPHPAWSGFMGYRLLPRLSALGPEGLQLGLERHPVDVGVAWHQAFGLVILGASVSASVDFMSTRIEARGTQWSTVVPRNRVLVSGALLVEFGLALRPGARIVVSAGPEVAVNTVDYAVDVGGQAPSVLLSPWQVRPRLALTLEGDVL